MTKLLNVFAAVATFLIYMAGVLFVSFCIWSVFDSTTGHIAALSFLAINTLAAAYLATLRISGRY